MRKLTVFGISFVIFALVLLIFVSAQEIEFQYPPEIDCGEEFSVDVTLIDFSIDVYDVKIDITDPGGERISEIYDGDSWHSTYNYVNDVIDTSEQESSSFQMNITEEYNGDASIEVKIRDSSNRAEVFPDYQLSIVCENDTEIPDEEEEENQDEEEEEISIELDWGEDEIVNGQEFEIESRAYNLEEDIYEIRVYITFRENNTIISETYYEDDDRWKSSTYYVDEAFTGPGDKSKTLLLRIKDDYIDFEGNARLTSRIRKSGTTSIIAEFEENIEILEGEEIIEEDEEETFEYETEEDEEPEINNVETKKEVIMLGNRNGANQEETEENSEILQGRVIYESESEKVKRYAVYFMNLILIGIIVLLLVNFKKERNLKSNNKAKGKNGE